MAATLEDYEAALDAGDRVQLVALFDADETRGEGVNRFGEPLLHRAMRWRRGGVDRAPMVAALLAAGIDPDQRDTRGVPALHRAAQGACTECLRQLLAAGVAVDVRDSEGRTALHLCDADALPVLLAAGADPAARSNNGRVPLHTNPTPGSRLLAGGVNTPDRQGLTPLHVAAFGGEHERVAWLLANGADAGMQTTARFTNEGTFDASAFDAPALYDFPPGQRPWHLAKWQYRKTRWSVGSPYLITLEALEKHTPRRFLFWR